MSEDRDINAVGLVVGLMLVVVGLLFLFGARIPFELVGETVAAYWPLVIVAVGLAFFAGMFAAGETGSGLAVPGCIVTTVGVLLFVQNLFGLWQTWAYAWALVGPGSVGLGLMALSVRGRKPGLMPVGRGLALAGLVLFALGAFFFEGILDISGFGATVVGRFLLPALIIVLGLWISLKAIVARKS